jgi:multicomponent Na+:H+ antiporter subunit F
MTAQTILSSALWLALVVLGLSFLLTVWRVIKGPTLPDRVVALDMLVGIVIGFIALIAIRTGFTLYIDIAISLGLVGFLATVAFARFILARGRGEETLEEKASPVVPAAPLAPKHKRASSRKPGAGPAVSRKAKK